MNQVEVKILQQSYLLACKEGQEARLTDAVSLVDGAMTRIHDAGKVRARERIAVLAALNLAYELGDLRQAHAQLLEQLPPPSAASTDEQIDESVYGPEAAAAFSAQSKALEALVARLEAVLNPAIDQANAPAEVLPEAGTEAELGFESASDAQLQPETPEPEQGTVPHSDTAPSQQAGFFKNVNTL